MATTLEALTEAEGPLIEGAGLRERGLGLSEASQGVERAGNVGMFALQSFTDGEGLLVEALGGGVIGFFAGEGSPALKDESGTQSLGLWIVHVLFSFNSSFAPRCVCFILFGET
jgi:hypothetical protein